MSRVVTGVLCTLLLALALPAPVLASGALFSRPATPPSKAGQVKVMTMNLFQGSKKDRTLQRPAAMLRAFNPDVVFIQEIDRYTARSGEILGGDEQTVIATQPPMDQVARLASMGGYGYTAFGSAMSDASGGLVGVAILSKYPLRNDVMRLFEVESCWLGMEWCSETFGFLEAIASVNGQDVLLMATHYHHQITEFPEHSQRFVSDRVVARAQEFPGPAFFGGDLNANPTQIPVQVIVGSGVLKNAEVQATRIEALDVDHIFYKEPYVASWYEKTHQPEGSPLDVSDHEIETAFFTLPGVSMEPNFGDNALFRDEYRSEVYVMQGGAKFHIPSVESLGLEWPHIYQVGPVQGISTMDKIGTMPRDNTVLRGEQSQQVFRIVGGKKYLERLGPYADPANGMVGVVPQFYVDAFPYGTDNVQQPPGGWLDAAGAHVTGWAVDLNTSSDSIRVRLYINNIFIQELYTTVYRPDVNAAYGVQGIHGFDFTIPGDYYDGVTRTVKVTAVDSWDGAEYLLWGAPKSLTLGEPPPPDEDPTYCERYPWKC